MTTWILATCIIAQTPLRVGLVGAAPFVEQSEGRYDGLAIRLWKEIERRQSLSGRMEQTGLAADEAIEQLERGELDVLVGSISITASRIEHVRFTQPYFQSSLGILYRDDTNGWLAHISKEALWSVLAAVASFMILLTVVGLAVWLAERGSNAQFPRAAGPGIATGIWFSLVTLTTTGYGDQTPRTTAGRLVTSAWMIVSLVIASSLIAGLTSAFSHVWTAPGRFKDARALAGRKIGAVEGTTAFKFALGRGASMYPVQQLAGGVAALERGDVEAIVFDRPVLQHWLNLHPDSRLVLSATHFRPEGYGFAAADPALLRKMNIALLDAYEDGTTRRLTEQFLPASERESD